MRVSAWVPSSLLARLIISIGFAAAVAGEEDAAPVCEKHVERTYTVTATVTVMGITVFRRSGVGGGFASLDETGTTSDRNMRLRFLSGTMPERAHGLNRLGFMEEHVHERAGTPVNIAYFGFITANPETSLAQARAALSPDPKATVCYRAAEGSSDPGAASYRVRDLMLPARYQWTEPAELLEQVSSRFDSSQTPPTEIISHSDDPQAMKTFLYALILSIEAGGRKAETHFLSNGKVYRMRTEQAVDEHTGEDLARTGWISWPEDLVRLRGTITRDHSSEATTFRLWFDRSSPNPLPLTFEFWPRSYLKLVFEAANTATPQFWRRFERLQPAPETIAAK